MSASDDTRQRLLQAAGQLFAEKGYEGASVRDICKKAQANFAAVNYHFHDKERLYIEAVKSVCQCQVHRKTSWSETSSTRRRAPGTGSRCKC